ncbi:MAG: hypothetical protein JKY37_31540, partial [Nannocystaceae bacterium]|nr:hypothetical protein [Nannocystaceae bacterium]
MNGWTLPAEQWRAWLNEGMSAETTASRSMDDALDELDERVLDCFRAAAFPAQSWETRVEDPAGTNATSSAPFDSMATVVRAAPE